MYLEKRNSLELWGGPECTVNRVGNHYCDQIVRTGHHVRIADLSLFAGLGIRKLRYPVLWERTAVNGHLDWTWSDERLNRIRELGMEPIAGLIHHGSGPTHTSLVDPLFPLHFSSFARACAERYPWITNYIPVNEPLTTSRFSGLYGHWYPHGRDDATFASAFLTQCRAAVMGMAEIRRVNKPARFIQTEDMGKTFSTRKLSYQAEFDNERRWITFDLLCGRVVPGHPLWTYFIGSGIREGELLWFAEHVSPPDVIGLNYYVTSERYLDHNLNKYPLRYRGGNGREPYADVEAVRVRRAGLVGIGSLIEECWNRYHLPIAVTEAHLACTSEEQARWFLEIWNAAQESVRKGIPVLGVTAWSLLGSFDWNSLVTGVEDHYESGVFDIRSHKPRPTVLASSLTDLANGRSPSHPVLSHPGWWRRPQRLIYSPSPIECAVAGNGSVVLITGAGGTLGRAVSRLCDVRGLPAHRVNREELDIADRAAVRAILDQVKPWSVVNAAGYVRVDSAEHEPQMCFRANTSGPALLAEECSQRGIRLVTFSSDLVFDGEKCHPYFESDEVNPLNVYGKSKAEAEAQVLQLASEALVIRTSSFFGPWDSSNFLVNALQTLSAAQPFYAADDTVVSPTYVPDLVQVALNLLVDGASGIWHIAHAAEISWADLATTVARRGGFDPCLVRKVPASAMELPARRPRYSALGSERATLLPELDDAIDRFLRERTA